MNVTKIIRKVVKELISLRGEITTLEVKNRLISIYDTVKWNQSLVSGTMDLLCSNGLIKNLQFRDNGKYRTYTIPKQKKEVISVNKTKLQQIFMDPSGKFQTVTWKAASGERTYSLKASRNKNNNGYIEVYTSKGEFKLVDPRTILKIKANGSIYKKK
jgi:hypothetical protein